MLITISVKEKDIKRGFVNDEDNPLTRATYRKLNSGLSLSIYVYFVISKDRNILFQPEVCADMHQYIYDINIHKKRQPKKFQLEIPDEYLNQKTIDKYTQEPTDE